MTRSESGTLKRRSTTRCQVDEPADLDSWSDGRSTGSFAVERERTSKYPRLDGINAEPRADRL